MTSDLVWDSVFVFENVALPRRGGLGAGAGLTLWKLAWFSQDISRAREGACFSRAYKADFEFTRSVAIY